MPAAEAACSFIFASKYSASYCCIPVSAALDRVENTSKNSPPPSVWWHFVGIGRTNNRGDFSPFRTRELSRWPARTMARGQADQDQRRSTRRLTSFQIEGPTFRQALSSFGLDEALTKRNRFKNYRRPNRKSPYCRGRTPWQRRRISSRDCNRTRGESPFHRNRHLVEFASAHLRR